MRACGIRRMMKHCIRSMDFFSMAGKERSMTDAIRNQCEGDSDEL